MCGCVWIGVEKCRIGCGEATCLVRGVRAVERLMAGVTDVAERIADLSLLFLLLLAAARRVRAKLCDNGRPAAARDRMDGRECVSLAAMCVRMLSDGRALPRFAVVQLQIKQLEEYLGNYLEALGPVNPQRANARCAAMVDH